MKSKEMRQAGCAIQTNLITRRLYSSFIIPMDLYMLAKRKKEERTPHPHGFSYLNKAMKR
jgi:hypothetical protein